MKIDSRANCANSPKNQLVQQLTVALAAADLELSRKCTTEDVSWSRLAEGTEMRGRRELLSTLENREAMDALSIVHVVSHGRAAAVNGTVSRGSHHQGFCHVFEFSSAKGTHVKVITTYMVALGIPGGSADSSMPANHNGRTPRDR